MSLELDLLAAGAATGLLVGSTGVGGGALMTPLLILLFAVPVPVAVATDLWFAIPVKLAAITMHRVRTPIDWPVVTRLWAGSLPVALGVAWLASAGVSTGKLPWLTQAVGAMVCLAAFGLWFGPAWSRRMQAAPQAAAPRLHTLLAVAAGALLGGMVALTSVGAGALGSALLLALYRQRLNAHALVLADLVHAAGLALVAGLTYAARGLVDWDLLGWLLLGALPAAMVGSRLATRLQARTLQQWLAALLLLAGVRAVWG